MNEKQIHNLLYEALQTEQGGIEVYRKAIQCAVNPDLKEEWTEYLEQTENHEHVVLEIFDKLGLDPVQMPPGRKVVEHIGKSLVAAMDMALEAGDRDAAQVVAAECVVHAETKDHQNWELIGEVAKSAKGTLAKTLKAAHEQVEDEEDEHLYHTAGWCRELSLEALGLAAVLPPPEEEKDVKTAIGAARAKAQREEMI